jgi:hypothetical protein
MLTGAHGSSRVENPSVPIHTSSNGDRWLLVRNPESGDVFVRHLPNAASGGKSSHIELEAFLLKSKGSPERESLLRMIGSLVSETTNVHRT